MAGLYLHIPFCKQACHYCDFHFSTSQKGRDEIIKAMAKELELQRLYLNNEEIDTIYFGGGTPSLLSSKELKLLFEAIHSNFSVSSNVEITLEANPDDLSLEKLYQLVEIGINRLSIGIQSFDDTVLSYLNRAHNSSSAFKCIEDARHVGFKNLSIDLIYAIPGQNNDAWRKNIKTAIALSPQHISSYSLTIEEKTVFGRWSVQGKLKAVEDDLAAEQLEILMDELGDAGYDQYEVSNFGRPGFYSNHNSSYWKREKYLGIGPSAHSYDGLSRQFNVSNNSAYLKSLEENTVPFELEILTREHQINEYLLTTLRTQWGCDLSILKKDFTYNVVDEHQAYIEQLRTNNLAFIQDSTLILTKPGKLLADKIASDLFC